MRSHRSKRNLQFDALEMRNLLSSGIIKAEPPPGLVGNVNANGQGVGSATLTGNGHIGVVANPATGDNIDFTSVSVQAHDGDRSALVHIEQQVPGSVILYNQYGTSP